MIETVFSVLPPIVRDDIPVGQRKVPREGRSWRRFHRRVRKEPAPLLATLSRYPRCVLVAGCQRSGTTMVTRIIAGSAGFRRFQFTHDDKLDAVLALAGRLDLPSGLRYCFQTTYLNERYTEYGSMGPSQKLIWVLRNPYFVIYSMVYHWGRFALNELYESSIQQTPELERARQHRLPWPIGLATLERTCIAYASKTNQLNSVKKVISADQLMVLDYDALIRAPAEVLRHVFAFVGEAYDDHYASTIRSDTLGKADRLSSRERVLIEDLALPVYVQCKSLLSAF